MDKIKVSSLDDLQIILTKINSGEKISITDLDISDISSVSIKIYGEYYSGDLTASICHSLCSYHTELLRTYCQIVHQTDNLRYLSSDEKEKLNIIFKVDSGCTEIINDLRLFIETTGEAISKMGLTPEQATICIITLTLSVTGVIAFSKYLKKKQNDTDKKTEVDKINAMKDGYVEIAKENTNALRVFAESVSRSEKIYSQVLKSLPNVDGISISSGNESAELDRSEVVDFVTNDYREKLDSLDLTKTLYVEAIKRNGVEYLTATCTESLYNESYSFNVIINIGHFEQQEIDYLFDSLKNGTPIIIHGNYKIRGGIIEKCNASNIGK